MMGARDQMMGARQKIRGDKRQSETEGTAPLVANPRPAGLFTGFGMGGGGLGSGGMGGFTTNEEPSPGSNSTTPNRSSPMWGGGNVSGGRDGFDEADAWEEVQRHGAPLGHCRHGRESSYAEDIDEDIGYEEERLGLHGSREGPWGEGHSGGHSSASMVNYKWRRGHMIGAGSYGRVYLGMNLSTGELIAVKQLEYMDSVEADKEKVESLESEISIMKTLRHRNVCGYLGTERSEGEDTKILNILLEYVPGGSISQLLESFGAFGEAVIKIYTRQILMGLEYLHMNKLAHRDIKGANILDPLLPYMDL